MPKTQRNREREQFWRQTMADWRASGRTIRDFCRKQQLTEPAFHYWQRELRKRGAAARTDPSTPPAFVLVTLIPTSSTAAIEVRCPSGHIVMIAPAESALRHTLCELFAAIATKEGDVYLRKRPLPAGEVVVLDVDQDHRAFRSECLRFPCYYAAHLAPGPGSR